MKAIESKKLLDFIEPIMEITPAYPFYDENQKPTLGNMLVSVHSMIEQDSVEVEPVVHAHWVESDDGITPVCSRCHRTHSCFKRNPDYCPNCGARMDEVTEDG